MSRIIRKLDENEINDCLLHLRDKVKANCYAQLSFASYVSDISDNLYKYVAIEQAYLQQLIYYKHYLENVRQLAAEYLEHEEIVSRLKGYRYRYNEIGGEIIKANEELDAAKKDRDSKKTVRDDAKKAYDTAVSNYNSWINSYYNPTKASLESDLTAANQTLSEERAELTRLRNLYNEKVAAKATAQSVLDTVKSRLSSLPTETYSQQNVYISPSLSVTFEYAGSTYTVPAVSGSYRIRFRQYSAGVMNLNQHFKVAHGYIDSSATWQEETSIYDVSGISAWVSVIYPAALGWKNAYLAAYQSAVDSLQDDIDELYDEISNQEEVVYDAEDAVEYVEGELRDLEDEKDEYYEDNVQPALDDYNAAEDSYQAAVQSVTNIENHIKALNTEKGECYDNYNTTWIELRDWESEHEWLGSPNINNFEYPLDSANYPGQDDDDDDE